jgi:hypothetical protein
MPRTIRPFSESAFDERDLRVYSNDVLEAYNAAALNRLHRGSMSDMRVSEFVELVGASAWPDVYRDVRLFVDVEDELDPADETAGHYKFAVNASDPRWYENLVSEIASVLPVKRDFSLTYRTGAPLKSVAPNVLLFDVDCRATLRCGSSAESVVPAMSKVQARVDRADEAARTVMPRPPPGLIDMDMNSDESSSESEDTEAYARHRGGNGNKEHGHEKERHASPERRGRARDRSSSRGRRGGGNRRNRGSSSERAGGMRPAGARHHVPPGMSTSVKVTDLHPRVVPADTTASPGMTSASGVTFAPPPSSATTIGGILGTPAKLVPVGAKCDDDEEAPQLVRAPTMASAKPMPALVPISTKLASVASSAQKKVTTPMPELIPLAAKLAVGSDEESEDEMPALRPISKNSASTKIGTEMPKLHAIPKPTQSEKVRVVLPRPEQSSVSIGKPVSVKSSARGNLKISELAALGDAAFDDDEDEDNTAVTSVAAAVKTPSSTVSVNCEPFMNTFYEYVQHFGLDRLSQRNGAVLFAPTSNVFTPKMAAELSTLLKAGDPLAKRTIETYLFASPTNAAGDASKILPFSATTSTCSVRTLAGKDIHLKKNDADRSIHLVGQRVPQVAATTRQTRIPNVFIMAQQNLFA